MAVLLFALKTLLHERAKTVAGLCGVAFAVCLAMVQIGMYIGAMKSASTVIDRSTADLWVIPRGAQNFEFTESMPEYHRYLVEGVPGVERVEPLVVGFGLWQLPNGGIESIEILGFDLTGELLRPWNLVDGTVDRLQSDRAIFVDKGDLKKLRVRGVGDSTEMFLVRSLGMRADIVGLTHKVKSFVASPIIMTSYKNALAYCQRKEGDFTYLLVRVADGHDPEAVKAAIERATPLMETYTCEEFSRKTQVYWDTTTGLGMALFASAALGILIGVGTVAMLLYMSTIDHLPQYATLKALGAPNHRVIALVACQSVVIGMLGYGIGIGLAFWAQRYLQDQSLYVMITPELCTGMLIGTLVFCIGAAFLSAIKIVSIDPGVVFRA